LAAEYHKKAHEHHLKDWFKYYCENLELHSEVFLHLKDNMSFICISLSYFRSLILSSFSTKVKYVTVVSVSSYYLQNPFLMTRFRQYTQHNISV
jgi:hypothetical protein